MKLNKNDIKLIACFYGFGILFLMACINLGTGLNLKGGYLPLQLFNAAVDATLAVCAYKYYQANSKGTEGKD